MKKTFKFLFLSAILLSIAGFALLMFSSVTVDKWQSIREKADFVWWQISFVRWAVILFLIYFLPKYFAFRARSTEEQLQYLNEEGANAESQGATYETLAQFAVKIDDLSKLRNAWVKLANNRRLIAIGLILVELVFVQMPHLL